MDKLREDSRKQFDAWWHEEYCHLAGSDEGVFVKYAAWQAWQSARASIVVDTPQLCGDGENDSEYTDGYNDGVTATEKTIRSIGLSIKGEQV